MRVVLGRLAVVPPALLGVSLLTWALLALAPGDAATALLGGEADPAALAAMRAAYALDAPWPLRYLIWLRHVASGDLGRSIQTGRRVSAMLLDAIGPTLELAAAALAASLLLGVPLALLAVAGPRPRLDAVLSLLAAGALAMPVFLLALLLILALSVWLRWLPSSGHVPFSQAPSDALRHLALPALTLAPALIAGTFRMARAALLEVLPAEYVRTAFAKGLSPARVLALHALRPALAPVAALLGLQLVQVLGGVAVTETMFAWPGLGKLMVDAVLARDAPVVQGVILTAATLALAANFAGDLLLIALDPRLRPSA